MDGDGRKGGPRDAQGFGYFSGQGGQAILSRYPLTLIQDKSDVLWRDAVDSLIVSNDSVGAAQRLSSTAHWAVRANIGKARLTLLTLAATPPIFDGPEDRNGRRNHDEVLLWYHILNDPEGAFAEDRVVLLGNFNLDPERGAGLRQAAARVLDHPKLQDPLPSQTTVSWERSGDMRMSYVLPDRALQVSKAQVMPPTSEAGPHRLVWVDLLVD